MEVLELARKGTCLTHVMYKCQLSYKLTKEVLEELIKSGMLTKKREKKRIGRGGWSYMITEKGVRLLKLLRNIERLLGKEQLPPPYLPRV